MGRYKKGTKRARSDLWEKAGGIDSMIKKLQKADIFNINTDYSSEIWSQLAIDVFNEDTHKNRHWLWVIWNHNRRGLRKRVHLAAKSPHHHNGTEEIQPADKDTEVADVETQCDAEILERETNFDSQPIYPDTDSASLKSTPEPTKVQEGEPGGNVQRQVNFVISMTRKMWDGIKPKGFLKLRPPWKDHVCDSFKEKNPCCALSFKYQHVKKPWSRKKNLPYLQIKAVCRFPSCPAKYSFTMQNKPAGLGQDVKMLVQQTGDIHHKLPEKKGRPATIVKREKIAKALTHAPSQSFHSTLQSTPNQQLLAGNTTEKVLDSEMRKKKSTHFDIMSEIHLMQTLLKEFDTHFEIPGYIQLFGMNPFIVHLFTERGIGILVHHLQSKSPVSLSLDVAGGLVSKIPEQPKRVLYYALSLPGKARDAPPLPVCEMLSNDHSVPPITFWLSQFTLDLSKYTQVKVHQVETDYSWALIQSVLLAFNKEQISSYLNRAYEFCTGKKSWDEMKSYTVLHICSAHILKAVRQAISRQTNDKGLRDFAMYAFARLQNASSMTESRTVFRAFCALLTIPKNTNLVKESLCVLESVILRSREDTLEDTTQSEDWESKERRHAMTIIGRSPFSACFQQIVKEVKEEVAGDEKCLAKEDNPYFCPGILTVLHTYLAIFPLWSGLLLGESPQQELVSTLKLPKTRETNCPKERWCGIVKRSIMHNEKDVKPGTFIRKMYQSLQARYAENIIRHNLPQKILLKPEPAFPDTQSKFISVPQSMPDSQKKNSRIHEDVAKSQKQSVPEPTPFPEGKSIHKEVSKSQKLPIPEPIPFPEGKSIHKMESKSQKWLITEPAPFPEGKNKIHKDVSKSQKWPIPEPTPFPEGKSRIQDVSKSQKQSVPEPTPFPEGKSIHKDVSKSQKRPILEPTPFPRGKSIHKEVSKSQKLPILEPTPFPRGKSIHKEVSKSQKLPIPEPTPFPEGKRRIHKEVVAKSQVPEPTPLPERSRTHKDGTKSQKQTIPEPTPFPEGKGIHKAESKTQKWPIPEPTPVPEGKRRIHNEVVANSQVPEPTPFPEGKSIHKEVSKSQKLPIPEPIPFPEGKRRIHKEVVAKSQVPEPTPFPERSRIHKDGTKSQKQTIPEPTPFPEGKSIHKAESKTQKWPIPEPTPVPERSRIHKDVSKGQKRPIPEPTPFPEGESRIQDVSKSQKWPILEPTPFPEGKSIHKEMSKSQKRPIPEPAPFPEGESRIQDVSKSQKQSVPEPTPFPEGNSFYKEVSKSQKRTIPEPSQFPEGKSIHKEMSKSQKWSSPEPTPFPAEALLVEEEIDILWTKPPNDLVVAVVKSDTQNQEFLLHHREFLTLRPHEWIFGETIECYLRAVLNAKGANLYQLSHYTTGVILNDTKDRVIRQGLKKVNFERYDGLISVVNTTHMHWRFVYLHATTNTIFILDPRCGNNEMEFATQACTKFGEYFRMRGNLYGRKDWVDIVWRPGTISHSFQEDGFNCAVFVMQMAKQVLEHFPKIPESIDITPSREEMCHTRKNMAKVILQASVSSEEYCSVCGQKDTKTDGEKDQKEELCTWVQCELCERWFHVQCLKMNLPPEEEPWVCGLCL